MWLSDPSKYGPVIQPLRILIRDHPWMGAQDFPSGFLLAMLPPALAADSGVVQFRAFNAGEELKAFLMLV